MIELTIVLLIFAACTLWEGRQLRISLEQEAKKGLIPQEHVPYLASYLRRQRDDWLPEEIPKKEYIRLATHLAQRGRQVALLPQKRRAWYELDYRRLQEEIRDLLGMNPSHKTS